MAFGDVGGATYPQRNSMPNSSVVDYTPKPSDWLSDFNSRYQWAQQNPFGGANKPMQLLPGADGYAEDNWKRAGLQYNPYIVDQAAGTYKINPQNYLDIANQQTDPAHKQAILDYITNTLGKSTPLGNVAGSGASQVGGYMRRAYGPTITELEKERATMLPREENAARQEQAFGQLSGWGQTNGVMSANYGDPDFGAINGNFGQDKLMGGGDQSDAPPATGFGATAAATPSGMPASNATSAAALLSGNNATSWGAARKRPVWGL